MANILDLCAGIGGAGKGYMNKGHNVTGVDINPLTKWFYPGKCLVADALEYARKYGHKYDFIHISPPCQKFTTLTKGTNNGRQYPDLLTPARTLLDEIGVPYVIENVPGAPMRCDLLLCGEMFAESHGLRVIRHRIFETTLKIDQLTHIQHSGGVSGIRDGIYREGWYFPVYGQGSDKGTTEEWQAAMGIDWTDYRQGISQAIPPAYTEYIAEYI